MSLSLPAELPQIQRNSQIYASPKARVSKAQRFADYFKLKLTNYFNNEKEDFMAEYIRDVSKRIEVEDSNYFSHDINYLQARSTKYGEIIYLRRDNKICLANNGKVLVEQKMKDFEILNDWNKRGIVLEIKEMDELESPIKLAKGQNKLKIIQGQLKKKPNAFVKSLPDSQIETENFNVEHNICNCIVKERAKHSAKRQIFRNLDLANFQLPIENLSINFVKVPNLEIQVPDIVASFCFRHEILVCWDNFNIYLFNLHNYHSFGITTGKHKIKYISIGLFPKILAYFEETHEIFSIDIQTQEAQRFNVLPETVFHQIWDSFIYNYDDNFCILNDKTQYMIIREDTKNPLIVKLGQKIQCSKNGSSLYFILQKVVYQMDTKTKKRTIIAKNKNYSNFVLSADESRIYIKYSIFDTTKGKLYVIQCIELKTLKQIFNIPLNKNPHRMKINWDNSIFLYQTGSARKIKAMSMQLNSFHQEIVGRFDSFIINISSDCQSILTITAENELYFYGLDGVWHGSKKDVSISAKSRSSNINGKLFIDIFENGKTMLCLFTQEFEFVKNITETVQSGIQPEQGFLRKVTRAFTLHDPKDNANINFYDEPDSSLNLTCFYFTPGNKKYFFINKENGDIIRTNEQFENVEILKTNDALIVRGCVLDDEKSIITLNSGGIVDIYDFDSKYKLNSQGLLSDVVNFCFDSVQNQLFCMKTSGKIHILNLEIYKEVGYMNFLAKTLPLSDWNCTVMIINPENTHLFISHNSILTKINIEEYITLPEGKALDALFNSSGKMQTDEQFEQRLELWQTTFQSSNFLNKYFNPLFVAGCNGITKGIQSFLSKQEIKYPILNACQMSPIVLCCFTNNLYLLDEICNYLRNSPDLYLTNEEISFLLKINRESVTALLVELFKPIPRNQYIMLSKSFENLESKYITQDLAFYSRSLFLSFLPKEIKQLYNDSQTYKILMQTLKLKQEEIFSPEKTNSIEKNKQELEVYIEPSSENQAVFYELKAKYDFTIGSEPSLNFLRFYTKNSNKNFLLSNWNIIIKIKWQSLRYFYWCQAFLYISQTFIFTAEYFYPEYPGLYLTNLIMLIVFLTFEIFSIAFYPKHYFHQIDNILDLCTIISAIILISINYDYARQNKQLDSLVYDSFYCLTILAFYIRSVLYMKVIKPFRHLITMLFAIAVNITDIILLFSVIIIGFGFLLSVSNPQLNIPNSFYFVLLSFYGGLDRFEKPSFIDWILTVVIGVFVSLIMANFVIGRISNQYADMESYQIAVSYKEMAKIMLEWEVWHSKLATLLFWRKKEKKGQGNLNEEKYHFFFANFENEIELDEAKLRSSEMLEEMSDFQKQIKVKIESLQNSNEKIIIELGNVYLKNEDIHEIINDASAKNQSRRSIIHR